MLAGCIMNMFAEQLENILRMNKREGQLEELINAAEAIVDRGRTETPNLMLIRQRTGKNVDKLSAKRKGPATKIC